MFIIMMMLVLSLSQSLTHSHGDRDFSVHPSDLSLKLKHPDDVVCRLSLSLPLVDVVIFIRKRLFRLPLFGSLQTRIWLVPLSKLRWQRAKVTFFSRKENTKELMPIVGREDRQRNSYSGKLLSNVRS